MKFVGNRLYNLKSHNVLSKILETDAKSLRAFAKDPSKHFDIFEINKNGKPRTVENPKSELKIIHKRIKRILGDIVLPDYVHSGAKGRSYKGNALAHVGHKYIATMDIEKFFPSCSKLLVWRFFKEQMEMSPDVADTLANLCCCNGHIPTGSPLSLLLAYLCNYKLFDGIHKDAIRNGYTFTLYVDDMTFSTKDKKITRTYHLYLNKLIANNGLRLKKSKVHYFDADADKVITGCKIENGQRTLKTSDKLKKKLFAPLKKKRPSDLSVKEARSALGRVHSARFIEGDIFFNLKDKIKIRTTEN